MKAEDGGKPEGENFIARSKEGLTILPE